MSRIIPSTHADKGGLEASLFFIFWFIITLAGLYCNDLRKLNFGYLLLGGMLACCIPLIDGLTTGEWLWNSFSGHRYFIFSVDFSWLLTGITALTAWWFWGRKKQVA